MHLVVMCIPADESGKIILKIIDDLQLQNDNTLNVFMDVSNLPHWLYFFQNSTETWELSTTNVPDNTSFVSKKNVLIFVKNDTIHLSLESYVVRNIKKNVSRVKKQ
ncbi:hypothetical protein NQ314_006395 [Rhamnusium bicolor]|uniref:Uncharacterized protein n=1 Tax=Rhamnusium bicolor TaxID=1586634 RepID=A0AAV8Z348_9CUCU|nr:hypothetical protein NQ314_006395 [Rhamnusium bicolor]